MTSQNVGQESGPSFDSRRYWEERLLAHPDITGVCYLGFSPHFVELHYRSRMRQLERALRRYQFINLSGRSVLDVGAGTGIWLDFWCRHGAEYIVGLDFAQPSVDQLKKRFPGALMVRADLRDASLPLPEEQRYDIISAFHVLLHIADADSLQRAIANLARHCAPGGWLIIADAIVQGQGYVPARRSSYDKVWSLAEYQDALAASGFTIQAVWTETVLFDNPLEASNRQVFRALSLLWRMTSRWGRSPQLTRLLGPAMMLVEWMACRLYADGFTPGSKMIFARKLM